METVGTEREQSAEAPWQQALARLTLDRLLVSVCFMIIGAAALTITYDPDSWWALRTGQLTWESGRVWTSDPWSSTVAGAYWPNHSWLTQLIFYVAYLMAGLAGPVLLCAAVAMATWVVLYRLCGGPPRLWAPTAALAAWKLLQPGQGRGGGSHTENPGRAQPWPAEERFWLMVLLLAGGVYLLLGSRSIRNTPLFTVAALPLLTHVWYGAGWGGRSLPKKSFFISRDVPWQGPSWQHGMLHAILGGLALVGCTLQAAPALLVSASLQPMAPGAISAVRACDGTLYNTFALGGELLWFVPERAVFVDSRNDPYPTELILRAVVVEQHGDYRDLFAEYNVTCALVPVTRTIYICLRGDQEWIETYHDNRLAVFARAVQPSSSHDSRRAIYAADIPPLAGLGPRNAPQAQVAPDRPAAGPRTPWPGRLALKRARQRGLSLLGR